MTEWRAFPGVFRPLAHHVPADARTVALDGYYTQQLGLTGGWVYLAACGSPCWPHPLDATSTLPPCPRCWSASFSTAQPLPDLTPHLAHSA